ncbi:MAG: tetratricopeptide repeat protein [Pyrinomonadaceae bacterium]|nr:tetratricopeptide repeat protein [Pyrinomonadaceae bacterium]MCX7638881.1 tetratricopeptide repeat protein [Pyrinomonadaceae bacterium]MDW8304983.1 tetratricopeptide repeat protein [Acidobacteriota bacterium]
MKAKAGKAFLLLFFWAFVLAQDNLPELVRRIKPSAVAIETFDEKGNLVSRGSGFFIAYDKIVTNRHVIEKSASAQISLLNGRKFEVKAILAVDAESDLALLQVEVPASMVFPLPIERNTPQEGESVVVIGNPFGLEGSVSNGIVSAIREIPGYGKIIQITAAISPGSSGSPVVNMRGQVIGVATLQAVEGQNINFAVPSERILQLKPSAGKSFASFNAEMQKSKRITAQNLYSQGLARLSLDDYAKAVTFFEKAVEIDPEYAEAWYQAGFCYGMLKMHQEALKASKRAVYLKPNWAEAWLNVGTSSFALGQFKEAAEAYKQATKIDPSNPDAFYALGLALSKLNRQDEEVLAYKRAIAIRPDHTDALEKLGLAYLKRRKFSDALQVFELLKNYKPDAYVYNYLGECYFEMDKVSEAVDAFNSALSFDPSLDRARYNLGRTYLKLGNRESALVQYEILRSQRSEWADKLLILLQP